MSWHIEVNYKGMRPALWSYGYPTKKAADQARSRLMQTRSPDQTFKVKKSP